MLQFSGGLRRFPSSTRSDPKTRCTRHHSPPLHLCFELIYFFEKGVFDLGRKGFVHEYSLSSFK